MTFKDVAGATDEKYFDITNINPKKEDGSDWGTTTAQGLSSGQLVLQRVTSDGSYTERIQWTSRGAIVGWQTLPKDGSTAEKIVPGKYLLKKGEGLIIAYKRVLACRLQISGEVELADMSVTIPASASASATYYAFGGNYTPVKIDIRSVLPKKGDGSDWGTTTAQGLSSGQLVLQRVTSDGSYSDRIQWTSRGAIVGWQTLPKKADEPAAHALAENEWTLEPGEGYILAYKRVLPCKLIFPSPMQEKDAE